MAQKQLYSYRQEDSSFDLTREKAFIIEKGLYRGFDFVPTANLTLRLDQATTGVQYLSEDGQTLISQSGIFKTSQGSTIIDDGSYDLIINDPPATNPRIDAVVAEHVYNQQQGGMIALIKFVKGTEDASPQKPVINENTQVVLGWITLPASVTELTGIGVSYERNDHSIWHKANFNPDDKANVSDLASKADQQDLDDLADIVDTKAPANANYAYTDAANEFTKQQRFNKGATLSTTTETDVPDTGNYFQATAGTMDGLTNIRVGTRITIRATDPQGFLIRHNATVSSTSYLKIFNPRGTEIQLVQNDVIELIQDSDAWIVVKQPDSQLVQVGFIMKYKGNPSNIPNNWALCNGQTISLSNGGSYTVENLSGKFIVGYDLNDPDYNAIGKQGGQKELTIEETNLPAHSHGSGTLVAGTTGSEHIHNTPVPSGDSGNLGGGGNDAWNANLNAVAQTIVDVTSQHSHDITGTTADTGGDTPLDNRSPYYTLAFIEKYR